MVFRVYFDTWDFVLNGPERMEEEIGLYFFEFNSFNEIIIHFRRLKDHFEHKFRKLFRSLDDIDYETSTIVQRSRPN
ncbi:hypothetical protein RhiirA4_478507 [Rhizophagus irregularis]|uniref:Uncharacterized protein n=1 Tax=Rhizophagus irregularis TaxID=588596 RepID=A0A2I1HEX4_9GLOM|nr:hypothetical protein RhiirA4_478507 [Rhizophagus irregularis]